MPSRTPGVMRTLRSSVTGMLCPLTPSTMVRGHSTAFIPPWFYLFQRQAQGMLCHLIACAGPWYASFTVVSYQPELLAHM